MFKNDLFAIQGKVKLEYTQEQAMKAQRRSRGIATMYTLSLTSVTYGGRWSMSRPATTPGKRPSTHCHGGWVGPRASLDKDRKYHPQPDAMSSL
jgi:hypothetical protein